MARLAKLRSRIEPDYRELDDALRLDHHVCSRRGRLHGPLGARSVWRWHRLLMVHWTDISSATIRRHAVEWGCRALAWSGRRRRAVRCAVSADEPGAGRLPGRP